MSPATPRPPRPGRGPPFAVLALAPQASAPDELADLAAHPDVCLLRAATLDAAFAVLRDTPVAVVLAASGVPAAWVDSLRAEAEARRKKPAWVVLRGAGADVPAAWRELGVGVVRSPVDAPSLARIVDVVLGLKT